MNKLTFSILFFSILLSGCVVSKAISTVPAQDQINPERASYIFGSIENIAGDKDFKVGIVLRKQGSKNSEIIISDIKGDRFLVALEYGTYKVDGIARFQTLGDSIIDRLTLEIATFRKLNQTFTITNTGKAVYIGNFQFSYQTAWKKRDWYYKEHIIQLTYIKNLFEDMKENLQSKYPALSEFDFQNNFENVEAINSSLLPLNFMIECDGTSGCGRFKYLN